MEENTKIDPQIIRDYNAGYDAQTHAPDKLQELINGLPADKKGGERFEAILAGQARAQMDQYKQQVLNEMLKDKDKDKDKGFDH